MFTRCTNTVWHSSNGEDGVWLGERAPVDFVIFCGNQIRVSPVSVDTSTFSKLSIVGLFRNLYDAVFVSAYSFQKSRSLKHLLADTALGVTSDMLKL